LYLLYVVKMNSMPCSSECHTDLILERMRQLGESVLLGAQKMAKAQGIVAEHCVYCGDVGDEVSGLCHELDADYLVLGQPVAHKADNVFTPARLAGLVDHVQKQTRVRVIQSRRNLVGGAVSTHDIPNTSDII
jgi:hypothetical protein